MLSSLGLPNKPHNGDSQPSALSTPVESEPENPHSPSPTETMFSIEARQDTAGRVVVIGRPTRKRAGAFLNIPISQELRKRLDKQVVGSLAMGTSALLEWALQELQRRGISIEARPQA